jgi:serine O-acetyltransferase
MTGPSVIRSVIAEVRGIVATARSRDPAARDVGPLEILLSWPGVHAVLAHRLAHALFEAGVPVVPRLIAALARSLTGIEIHPAATIGNDFFIDHGMGVVIGETAEIGDGVTLYQGVTLGGTGFATGKRHPTVQDNVTVGSGAKMLGPITIGHGAKIGANTVVIHDVPPNATVVGNPGHPVRVEGRRPEGPDADWIHLPDPVAEAIKGLASRIAVLEAVTDADHPADGAALQQLRATAARQADGRSNPSTGPSPAGG